MLVNHGPSRQSSRGLQAIEMTCYRKILRISYKDHVTNEEVRAKIQQAIEPHEDLLIIVKICSLQWYGHVSRSSGLAKAISKAHRVQCERHNFRTHRDYSSYSCCPNIDKTNVIPNHWRGNGLQNVSHFHINSNSETYVLQRREALITPAWSLYEFRTTSSDDVTCISPEYNMPWQQKESIMCVLDLGNEVYYHHFTVSTPTNCDRFIVAFKNPSLGTFW